MAAAHKATRRPAPTPRILLVEDDVEVGNVLDELLTEVLNFTVTRAYNADEAFEELRDGQFDLILTDIVMPGSMNGVEMAKQIRSEYPDMPIILSTGNAPQKELEHFDGFPLLRKPYGMPKLREQLAKAGLRP